MTNRDNDGTDTHWMTRASCRGLADRDYDPWFPNQGTTADHDYAIARLICASCPVRVECAEYALANGEPHGLWAGLTPRDRDELRRGAA